MVRKSRLSVAVVLFAASLTWATFLAPGANSNAAVANGQTERVSVHDGTDAQAPDSSYRSQMSADGTQVAFVGQDNLTNTYDNGCCVNAVYVRDLKTDRTVQISAGGTAQAGVSIPNGERPDKSSDYPSISASGRYVSFATKATNLFKPANPPPPCPNTCDGTPDSSRIVVCDRDPNGDGKYDEPQSTDPAAPYLPDYRCYQVARIDTNISGNQNDFGIDGWPHLSGDGQSIVWAEKAAVSTPDGAVYQRRVKTARLRQAGGSFGTPAVVYTAPAALGGLNSVEVDQPQISNDGRHIVARLVAVQPPPCDPCGLSAIVESDLAATGEPGPLRRVDAGTTAGTFLGSPTTDVEQPGVSGDGNVVVFGTSQVEKPPQVFAVDTTNRGAASPDLQSTYISRVYTGDVRGDGVNPAVSADGRYVAFVTDQPNMHEGTPGPLQATSCLQESVPSGTPATRTPCQLVVRDRLLDAARAAASPPLPYLPAQLATPSIKADCGVALSPGDVCVADFDSGFYPSLSSDGAKVAYDADADDLVPGDTNTVDAEPARDVFVRTWQPTVTANTLADFGTVTLGQTSPPQNLTLTTNDFGPIPIGDVLITGANKDDFTIVGSTCAGEAVHELDPCAIMIEFAPTGIGTRTATVSVYAAGDVGNTTPIVTRPLTGFGTRSAPSPLAAGDTQRTSVNDGDGAQAPNGGNQSMISGNGRWDVFVSSDNLAGRDTDGNRNIFVRDLADPERTLQISLRGGPGTDPTRPTRPVRSAASPRGFSPNGDSYRPSISSDGRFVSFLTAASDIVPLINPVDAGDTGTAVVVCDRDPSGARDSNGDPILDRNRPKTRLPDYVCYDVYSNDDNSQDSVETSSRPRLSGDGTQIAWVQGADTPATIVQSATLSVVGGPLRTPGAPQRVDTFVNFDGAQTSPVLSFDASRLVYSVRSNDDKTSAIIESDTPTGLSIRMDTVPGSSTTYIGDDPNISVREPTMAVDTGSKVAFTSGTFTSTKVYVATRTSNTVTSLIASLDNDGAASQGFSPALSGDGRYLAFVTNAFNMHNGLDGPAGGCREGDPRNRTECQIVARDLVRDAARATSGQPRLPGELVSASTKPDCGPPAPSPSETCAANGQSGNPSLDATGSEIGFDSFADDLLIDVTDDNRDGQGLRARDAFVRTWRPALSGNDLNFGSVLVGQPTDQTFVITASGFGPISLGDFSITGTNAGDFTLGVTTCVEPTATLHDSSCLISVRFSPAAKGARTGAISVVTGRNSYPRKDPLIIRNLTGVGVTRPVVTPKNPQVSTNPTVLDFGSQRPLKVPGKTRSVTVSNTGNGTLNVTGVTVIDSTVPGAHVDYTVNATDCLGGVPPGGSCTITVTFVGHAVGARGAVLVITENAPGGLNLVGLRATVVQPTITANPGIAPTGRVTTVNGTGFAPNQVVAVQFKGTPGTTRITADNAGQFSVGLVILARGEGGRTITAQSEGVDPSIKGDGPFLVVLGTVNDLIVVNRH